MTAAATNSPTLGLALLVALAGGLGAIARALLIHHMSVRRSDPLRAGVEGRHQGARRSGLVDPADRRRAGRLAQRHPRCRLGGNRLERLAKASSVCRLSVSVGSIMSASSTMSGK
jgi:hypothetical protein